MNIEIKKMAPYSSSPTASLHMAMAVRKPNKASRSSAVAANRPTSHIAMERTGKWGLKRRSKYEIRKME